ncbi:swi5-like zinc finger protein [Coemansia spiralis]|uniref:Swi5-like zinc finger protein n=2 Tax=Coemansia TaxID=4863 RepID=A0A9W8KZU2_9FUNG|nr:swi5-like zinc finger protein [Coemansia umbellata]KAJ2621802.1 swi5-like zinc finger protein [Coemansia sp. RSA 1358]KAJ2681189.1 swi5-like zinc finger protein [Coemansia spiralis]
MDASPSKRSSKAVLQKASASVIEASTSLVSDEKSLAKNEDHPLFKASLEDERKKELEDAIGSLRQDLDELAQKRDELLAKSNLSIEQARKMNEEHIDRLHRYNDIKDAGQIMFGKLAELKGKTVKEIYEEYCVDLKD